MPTSMVVNHFNNATFNLTPNNNHEFKNSKITEIKLPESLQEIADGSFEDCPLSTVIYSGSSKQWKKILIDKKANKKFLKIKVQFEKK